MRASLLVNRVLALAVGLIVCGAARAQDEAQVFNAFSVAVANGSIVRMAEKQVMVVGTVKGPMFIETDEGPMPAGTMACAASLRIDRENRRQTGSGACTFTAEDGAAAWGEWECAGYALLGCRGKFTLNGGSGRFQGVSGEGAVTWRPNAHELQAQLDGTTLQNTSGVVIWRDFKLTKK